MSKKLSDNDMSQKKLARVSDASESYVIQISILDHEDEEIRQAAAILKSELSASGIKSQIADPDPSALKAPLHMEIGRSNLLNGDVSIRTTSDAKNNTVPLLKAVDFIKAWVGQNK